jgi:hypothetical protein
MSHFTWDIEEDVIAPIEEVLYTEPHGNKYILGLYLNASNDWE